MRTNQFFVPRDIRTVALAANSRIGAANPSAAGLTTAQLVSGDLFVLANTGSAASLAAILGHYNGSTISLFLAMTGSAS